MTPRNTRSSHSTHPHVSELCTEKEFIVLDLTSYVREFCEEVDRQVENLSYDIEGILREYTTFMNVHQRSTVLPKLIESFLYKRYVKIDEDAPMIAEAAVDILYKQITWHIKDLGYIMGAIHNLRLRLNPRNQQLNCTAIMMVI